MAPLLRVVLDVLKPHEPQTVAFVDDVADLDGVTGVNAALIETDRKVENLKLTIEGDDLDYDAIQEVVRDLGGTIHSVDQVVAGETLVEESSTHQD